MALWWEEAVADESDERERNGWWVETLSWSSSERMHAVR